MLMRTFQAELINWHFVTGNLSDHSLKPFKN